MPESFIEFQGRTRKQKKTRTKLKPNQVQANAPSGKKAENITTLEVNYGLPNRVPVLTTLHLGSGSRREVRVLALGYKGYHSRKLLQLTL